MAREGNSLNCRDATATVTRANARSNKVGRLVANSNPRLSSFTFTNPTINSEVSTSGFSWPTTLVRACSVALSGSANSCAGTVSGCTSPPANRILNSAAIVYCCGWSSTQPRSGASRESHLRVNLRAFFHKLLRFFFHAAFEGFFLGHALFGGVFADVFGDLHRTEMRAAHGAEVRGLRAFLQEGFVVELTRTLPSVLALRAFASQKSSRAVPTALESRAARFMPSSIVLLPFPKTHETFVPFQL